ncbi:MAG: MFS transporter [bacterium]|nr:MFS transporter [bacterium]
MDNNRRNVWGISSAFLFIFFGFGTAQQYLVILLSAQNQRSVAIQSLLILYGTFLFSGIFIASIIPRLGGLRRSLLLGASTYALFVFSIIFHSSLILYIASFLIGLGASLLWVSSGQIIADSSDNNTAGKNFAYQRIGMYIGNIFGIIVGGYLMRSLSFEKIYLILTCVIIIGLLILLFVRPLKKEVAARIFRPYYIFNPSMLLLFPLIFIADFLQAQVFTAMNLVVVNILGIGSIVLMVTLLKISNIVGSFSSGILAAKHSKAILLSLLVIMAIIGCIFFITSENIVILYSGVLMLGLSMASIYPVTLALLKETMPPEEYPYILGTFYVYSNIGVLTAIGSNSILSPKTSFLPGIFVLFLSFIGIFLFSRKKKNGVFLAKKQS